MSRPPASTASTRSGAVIQGAIDGPGARWRRARRAVARRHHPDRGGDSATYLAELAEVDRRFGVGLADAPPPCPSVRGPRVPRRSPRRRLARTVRRVTRGVRARLPRWAPGARHWIDL
jgi:hypothetical protein